MSVPIQDRYRITFEHHRFVSEYRLSLIKGWAAAFVALAAAFVWSQSQVPKASFAVCAIAVLAPLLFWAADHRHRPAIGVLKDVGSAIEEDEKAEIPKEQQYFKKLDKGISHSRLIDWIAILSIVLFSLTTGYLLHSGGKLPGHKAAQQMHGAATP